MANPDTAGLKIGDLISLKSPKWECWLGTEGILLDNLSITELIDEYGDCIFSIHLQRQYSASRELDSFLETYAKDTDIEKTGDEGMKQYLKALNKGRDNEIRLNDSYMQNKTGEPVNFGDIIQLFHVKSSKYLVVNPKVLANVERENSKVALSSSGNIHSWVQFVPRFRIDREGDRIFSNAELYIRIVERSTEYIHAAEKNPRDLKREVNCSMEKTSWKMIIYQDAQYLAQKEVVLASQLIYIHDAETRSNITIAQRPLETLDDDDEPGAAVGLDDEEEGNVAADENTECIHEFGDIILQLMDGDAVDTRSVWILETVSIVKGGPLQWRTEHARFKNVSNGLYLKYKKVKIKDENTGEYKDKWIFTTTASSTSSGTLFHFFESNSVSKNLSKFKALQIGAGTQWLVRGEHIDTNFKLKSSGDKAEAVSLLINDYIPFTLETNNVVSMKREPLDMFSALSVRLYLKHYLDMTEIPQNRSTNTLWPGADSKDVGFFQNVVTRAKNFAQGFDISADHIVLGVDKADQLLRVQRQKIICELGVLEMAMRFVNRLKPITAMYDKSVQTKSILIESEQSVLRFGNMLLAQTLDLVYYCILDCPNNQMYVADFLPDLLAHLSSQPIAGSCVTAMLSTNMELQETKIGVREISIFVQKLRESKMNSMYLNLLQSCCSCQGQGVDANQCRVAEMIFEDTNDIVIHVMVDFNKLTPTDWGSSIYIPEGTVLGSPMEGALLVEKGLPELALAWTTNAIDFSPLGLFGKLSVNVADLYKIPVKTVKNDVEMSPEKVAALKKAKAKMEKSLRQKKAVAEYFINEMYLGAEMCMDRNYVAMHKLDALFSYESLVTILKMNVQNTVKAGACRLLFCLHVDRDPQIAAKIPCLTRTWTDITKHTEPQLPYVEPIRRNSYALIQQLLSEHISGMKDRRWDLLSKPMLEMLSGLLRFNFYGCTERMQDVITPVISAIDRRLVDYADKKKSEKSYGAAGESSKNELGGDEDEEEEDLIPEIPKISWQKRTYDFFESLPVMCFILLLVLAAVALTIYQVAADIDETPLMFGFGLVVLGIFLVDFFMRFYCYYHTYGKPCSFLSDPFNIIDQIVILIDLAFLFLPDDAGGENAKFTKTLRLIRLVRLVRVLRAVKVINAFTKKKAEAIKWIAPIRYGKIPMFELETMTEAIKVLLFISSVIEDRSLSLLMRKFYLWEGGMCGSKTPGDLFKECVEECEELTLGVANFDHIFIDAIMFKHTPLVQGALNTLMARHSMRATLLKNAQDVQLLVSPKRERQFRLISATVQQLERNAETHELWGELETDLDHATNKQTKEIIRELVDLCRVRSPKLEVGMDYIPDPQIQNLLRNLGLFDIALKVLGLLDSVAEDEETGELGEVALNTRELCLLCNELVYWFTFRNPANQEIVYDQLDFFLDSLDDEIKSHNVIRAIFKDNEALMKLVPHSYLTDMANKIAGQGQSHHYLALSAAITHVGDKNITKNQFEIVKTLCGPSRIEKVSCFLCSVNHPDYQNKIDLMKDNNEFDDDLDNMPPMLAYHLAFLEVLSNCTVGRINITSIEAKVQSVYGCVDIVDSIMHPQTSMVAKKWLTLHLFNAIIEVEIMIPLLEKSAVIWSLLASYTEELKDMTTEIEELDRTDWRSEKVSRLKVEYHLACVMCLGGFFARYYDPLALSGTDNGSGEGTADITKTTVAEANNMMNTFYKILKEFYSYNSPRIAAHEKTYVYEALEAINKSAKTPFYVELDKIHLREEEEEDGDDDDVKGIHADALHEKQVHEKYEEFMQTLEADEDVQAEAGNEIKVFIEVIEGMAFVADSSKDEIRFEPFIQKLVAHIRESIVVVNGERRIAFDPTATATWIIKCFRTLIENAMGMSIFERDDDGGDEEDEAAAPVVTALNENGVTGLCLELIALGIDETLQSEVIKLLVGMLFKEGGAREVQGSVNNYLMKNNSELFFKQVRATIQKLISWHKWNDIIILEEGEEPEPPDDILIIRMLQLLSEGHYLPNQDIMREQPNNLVQINLLDDLVIYFNSLSRLPCQTSTNAAIRVGATIVEIIQGPCVGNQSHFALNTDLVEIQNRILRSKVVNDCLIEEEVELKKTCLDTISALLEGQMPSDQVTERILSVIHLDIIIVLSKPPEFSLEEPKELTEEEINLQTDCAVLLQMLCDYKPSIREELEAEGGVEMDGDSTACVEISWDGVLNRRFFNVPDICALLAKSTKDKLVLEVDRSNPENKLIDFLTQSQDLYREVKHQEKLTEIGIAAVFSKTNADRATWLTFILAVIINCLMIAYYTAVTGEAVMPDYAVDLVSYLNYAQMSISFFTMILMFVVRSPVIAQGFREDPIGYYNWEVILYTALDPMTLYYVVYLGVSMLGQWVAHYYLALLLLDIVVKDVTTADVLNAVVQPRKQLMYALLLGLFVCYIFSFYTFMYFRHQVDSGDLQNFCSTLFDCTKFCISYGLQNGGGISDNFYHAKGARLILDLAWFIVVLVVFINIIFGIVIDTFSSLRAAKNEKAINTTEFCFICSIPRQTFDRNSDVPDGFKTHIKNDHNMWSYMNFIFFLWEQDKDDDDGLEYYVRNKIYTNEITWFPMHKAMCLDQALSNSEALSKDLQDSVGNSKDGLTNKLDGYQQDIKKLLFSLTETLQDKSFIHGDDYVEPGEVNLDRYQDDGGNKEWENSWGYDIGVHILELRGLDMLEDELMLLNFRLISESGMYSNEAARVDIDTNSCFFDQQAKFSVGESCQLTDSRSFQIQVLQKSGGGVAKFVSVIEFTLAELAAAISNDNILEKKFTRQGQIAACTIVVKVEVTKASMGLAGIGEEDEDGEDDL